MLAYRRAATRIRETGGPVAQLALDGKAKEPLGIGKTIEEKIVEVVETRRDGGADEAEGARPEEVVKFMRLPGLGPKTARRIWKELGVTTLAGLKEAAEQERLRVARRPRRQERGEDPEGARRGAEGPRESRRLLGTASRPARARRGAARAPGRGEGLGGRLGAPPPRDVPRPRRDRDLDRPAGADRDFTSRDKVADVVAKGDTKATVLTNEGLRFDLRVVPPESYGNLLQHFTGSKEHNVALREDAVRRGFSRLRVRGHERRDRRGVHGRGRGGALRPPRLRLHPARAARERRRAGGRAERRAAEARRARRPPRRPALALDLVGREGDDRGDGARRRRRSGTSTSRSATTRRACARAG